MPMRTGAMVVSNGGSLAVLRRQVMDLAHNDHRDGQTDQQHGEHGTGLMMHARQHSPPQSTNITTLGIPGASGSPQDACVSSPILGQILCHVKCSSLRKKP